MPLGFRTLSHGVIPVGFFNIDCDLLLVNNYFAFATDVCEWISNWAKELPEEGETAKDFYVIGSSRDIGNLHWAINGIDHHGFIPEVYRVYPFPALPEDFKQKPEGWENRGVVEPIVKKYAEEQSIAIRFYEGTKTVAIGDYVFEKQVFHEILDYIWRGGMPMWRDNDPPQYVRDMMEAVRASAVWLFR
jgi:hypothetical protein